MKTPKQEEDSLKLFAIGMGGCIILLLIIILFSCATTYTYTVTNEQGTETVYKSRKEAILAHDKANYRKPLSVTIDSVNTKE